MSTPEDPFAPPPEVGSANQPPTPPTPPTPPPPPGAPGPSQWGAPAAPPPGYGQPASGHFGYNQPGYGQQPGYPPAARKTNGLAIAALVCSLAGFAVCVSAPVGLVLGIVALGQIKKTGEEGRGLALAGAWVGGVLTAIAIIGFALIVALSVWFADEVDDVNDRCRNLSGTAYQECIDYEFDQRFGING